MTKAELPHLLLERCPLLTDSAAGTWFQTRFSLERAGGDCCDRYNIEQPGNSIARRSLPAPTSS